MKKVVLTYLLFNLFATITSAQNNAFKHEFDIDAAPVFRSSNGFTLLYRYHLTNLALRAQANVYYENTDNETDDAITTPAGINYKGKTNTNTIILNTEFRIGLQRNWSYEKWGFYIGADILAGSSNKEDNLENKNPQSFGATRNVSKNTTSSTSYGIAPLAGITYKLGNRFAFSLENSFAFTYGQNSASTKDDYYFTPIKGVEGLNNTSTSNSSGNTTKFDFSPSKYLRIFVGFKF